MQFVEAGVAADLVVVVAASHAVGVEGAGAAVDLSVRGGDEARVAEGGEVFCGVEAEGGGVAEGAGGTGWLAGRGPLAPEGLGGVFNEEQSGVVALEGGEGIPVGALAVEVDGQHGSDVLAGVAAQDFGDRLRREVEGAGIDVGEERAWPRRGGWRWPRRRS